jgi:hypothetical protein
MGLIRVRFIENRSLLSKGIAKWTGSLFSHCEFGTPQGTWIGALSHGGIQERPADYCRPSREYYYEVPCSDAREADLLWWARGKIGTKYNTKDILGLLLQARGLNSPSRMICSEFVVDGLLYVLSPSYVLNVSGDWTYRITPEEAHLSPLFVGHLKRKKP